MNWCLYINRFCGRDRRNTSGMVFPVNSNDSLHQQLTITRITENQRHGHTPTSLKVPLGNFQQTPVITLNVLLGLQYVADILYQKLYFRNSASLVWSLLTIQMRKIYSFFKDQRLQLINVFSFAIQMFLSLLSSNWSKYSQIIYPVIYQHFIAQKQKFAYLSSLHN